MGKKQDNKGEIVRKIINDFKNNGCSVLTLLDVFIENSFIVPCTVTMSDEDVEQFLESQVGDIVTAQNEIRLKPDILINGEKRFFPIFSSMDQMGKEYASHFSTIEMPIDSIIDMLNNISDVHEIVIDAFTQPFVMSESLLILINNHILFSKGEVIMTSKSKEIIDMLLAVANEAINQGDFENAVKTYKQILGLESNETAQFNLGVLYAQGKGIKQDYKEAAYWFHQAELSGDEEAGKVCTKCLMDYTYQNFNSKTPERLYNDMLSFVSYIYPQSFAKLETNKHLFGMAGNFFNKKEYAPAAKIFRAAAEYGDDGYSQNYLAVLYNAGAGVPKNDLAALYWFDKAVDNGVDEALQDRDGILNAYKQNFSATDYYKEITELASWCRIGSKDVPKDSDKAEYWRKTAEDIA